MERKEKDSDTRRISVDLPIDLIEGVDELKKEWGFRRRGAVLQRLLEVILAKESDKDTENNNSILIQNLTANEQLESNVKTETSDNMQEKALVIIGDSDIEIKEINKENKTKDIKLDHQQSSSRPTGIELPGFVRKKADNLRESLGRIKRSKAEEENYFTTINIRDLYEARKYSKQHWINLYGKEPALNVVEASMIWLAVDIWPQIDGSENFPFTWNAASKIMNKYCANWTKPEICFENVIVTAGVLEDPFSTQNLTKRVPTLIRRFVNRFKRSQNVTSFQTLESTMTVHGALKLLGLPTQAGSSLTLKNIRDAYKTKALSNHPDAGGTSEAMRKLNEGYQLLKDLYK